MVSQEQYQVKTSNGFVGLKNLMYDDDDDDDDGGGGTNRASENVREYRSFGHRESRLL
jgi:hypothetical protein